MTTHGMAFRIGVFRTRLLLAMTIVVAALTLGGLYVAEQSVREETQHDMASAFSAELALLRTVREIRHDQLTERCRALVRKPRIHAALEDNALDLLYPSAKDELGDALPAQPSVDDDSLRRTLRARFYRFLDRNGTVIPPVNTPEVGILTPAEEQRLSFATIPQDQEVGCMIRADGEIIEVIATPIISSESGETIAALVAGFPTTVNDRPAAGLRSGLWLEGALRLPGFDSIMLRALGEEVQRDIRQTSRDPGRGRQITIGGKHFMLFVERLNPTSMLAPTYEVGVFPLASLLARQNDLRWKATVAGILLLSLGIGASFYISTLLAAPVRELARVSEENQALREKAEVALEVKRGELDRSARFSANASHQLKTPVAVLRAGLDEILAREEASPEVHEEVALLVHQTFRLSGIIEDLLLLSRLESGRLQLSLGPVDLRHAIDTCRDDLDLLNEQRPPAFAVDLPPEIPIQGDLRYTMLIIQNLLENAHKYGTPGEVIHLTSRSTGSAVFLSVRNRGTPIPPSAQEQIFERFHRAGVGENIPGHGLGLNLARELARLHGGDLRLVRSNLEWTEFEVQFCPATEAAMPAASM